MFFPVPIPMYLPSYPSNPYIPRVSTTKIESGLSDISASIKEMSAKLDKKDICITTDTDAIRSVMNFVGPYVQRESAAYEERSNVAWRRINKIDKWKSERKKKAKLWKKEEATLWNEAKKQDAEFNYRNQPKGKWWRGWVETPFSKFLADSGYEAPKKKLKDPFDLGLPESYYESRVEMEMRSWEHKWRQSDVDRIASKPFWVDQTGQIVKLWNICEQIRGATLQVPSDLMQVVAHIVKEAGVPIEQGHKCSSCGSSEYIIDSGRKICGYCRTPKGG